MERRPVGRTPQQTRPISIELDAQRNAKGSVIIATGGTRVLCAASVDDRVPPWMAESGQGWVTAEYRMLPGSSAQRISRGKNSRATEIQRLIGRSLRAVVDLKALAGFTITVDCDVLDADGGTRTASISGAWVALWLACDRLVREERLAVNPVKQHLAATSVGMVEGTALLDLDYPEDSAADVDMNVVGTSDGRLVEVQGTAEGEPFSREELDELLSLAQQGIAQLVEAQRGAIQTTD